MTIDEAKHGNHRWMLMGPPVDPPPLLHKCIDCGITKGFHEQITDSCPSRNVINRRGQTMQSRRGYCL